MLRSLPGPPCDGAAPPLPSTARSRFDIESLLAKPESPRRSSLGPGAWAASPAALLFACPVGLLPRPVCLAELSATPPPLGRPELASSRCAALAGHLGAPHPWRVGGACKLKRVRTVFTPEQLERLEKEFLKQQYMVGTERVDLAATLRLTETQVKVWFQNRRIKWRKQSLEQKAAKRSSFGETQPIPVERSDGQGSDSEGGGDAPV